MIKYSTYIYIFLALVCNYNNAIASKKCVSCIPAPIQTSIVVDVNTGRIVHAKNAYTRINPASLTKVMTVYLVFEAIASGKLHMHKKLYVSHRAEQMQPSILGLKSGEYISVKDAILALIVKSANDVAVVIAENIAGSETRFAQLMNKKARRLGMYNTRFCNASGLHDDKHKSTPVDLAKLAIAVKRDFPQFYHLFGATSFTFKSKTIYGHNHVTANYRWSEGLKTGYTKAAGFNLMSAASRNNKSVVAIVTGSKSVRSRDAKMIALLDKHLGVNLSSRKTLGKMTSQPVKQNKKIARS